MSNYRKTMADALREMYPLTEETQIDEATMSSSQIARLKKAYEPMRDKKISTSNADKLSAMMDKVGKDKEALIQLFKADIPFVSQSAVTKLITKHNMKGAEINKLREEVDLDEVGGSAFGGTIDKIQKVVDDKQATKIDGVMVDTFTASLIMKIWNGVSKQNQDKMRKMKVTQLAKTAYKLAGMKEEVDLDEGTKQVLAHGGKGKYKVTKDGDKIEIKFGGKVVGTADFDRGADSFFVSIKGERGQKSFDDAQAIADYFAKNKITEEVELDEDMNALIFALWGGSAMVVLPALMLYNALPPKVLSKLNANSVKAVGNLLSKFKKDKNYKPTSAELDDSKKLENEVKNKEPSIFKKAMSKLKSIKSKKEEVGLDEGKMNNTTMQANKPRIEKAKKLMGPSTSRKEGIQMVAKGMPTSEKEATKLVDTVIKMMQKNDYVPEEVDLDENLNEIKKHIDDLEFERKRMTTSGQESLDKLIKAKSIKDARKAFDDMYGYEYDRVTSSGQESMVKIGKMLGMKMEEVDLDEGKMSQLHQYIKDKKSAEEIAKLMKLDVKTVKSLMSSHHPEEVEESAASDARRAMRADPDMRQKFSKDVSATDDDVKGASKNIMMQMRKAQSLNGRFDVEFADGKKVKIPAKMAIAVQQKYNSMKRPAEKEKFQAKIGKSYKDMLSALKEELQPKKESILERMNRKIKENKDG